MQVGGVTPPGARFARWRQDRVQAPVLVGSGVDTVRFSGSKALGGDSMTNLFAPKTIALVGASPTEGTIGRVVLENLVKGGYTGKVYPVNPKYDGLKPAWVNGHVEAFAGQVDQLPANAIDLAVIMSPKQTVPAVVDELGKKGVKSVVVISAGFGESGNRKLAEDLEKALKKHGIRMIGPNCVGVANGDPAVKMNATFVSGEVSPGRGAIMSQSGAVGIDLIQKARLAGLGFARMASIGNQADVDSAALLKLWENDPKVKYVLGYLESVKDPAEFRQIAERVSRKKPVVLIKSGKSETAKKAASSHTGSLAGSDTAVDALFKQTGVHRVDSIDDLFAVARAFERAPALGGNRVAVASNSGGYGVMLTDIIETRDTGLKVARLRPETVDKLKKLLPEQANTTNPVDTIATTPADTPENFKKALLAMAGDPEVDALITAIVPLLNMKAEDVGRVLADVQAQTDKPVIGVLSVGQQELLDIQNKLDSSGVEAPALYATLEEAMTGLSAMEKQRRIVNKPIHKPVDFPDIKPQAVRRIIDAAKRENRNLLTTTESLHVLEAYGIRTARHALVNKPNRGQMKAAVLARAQEIGYPIAIKLVSKTITHKTDIGGVAFDLKNPEALSKALDTILDNLAKVGADRFGKGEGIMVQQSVPNGRETLIGFKDDEQFGKMMAFGLGGIYVNIFKDVNFRLAPLTHADAREMVETIQGYPILKGYRGKPGVDFETLYETILRYSRLAADFPELAESDINPFFAQPSEAPGEKGGYAVDARFSLK